MTTETETTSLSPLHPEVTLKLRPSQNRSGGNHGWLKTFHSFAVDTEDAWGALRVLNEDRVEPANGFGLHGHREFEIFSYVVSGELEHKDSMGNTEILKRGDLQMTSAGTGIRHSEKAHGPQQVHFLQIWSYPSRARLDPKYFTRHFSDEEKQDKWAKIVAPVGSDGVVADREGTGPAPVNSPLTLYATLLSPGNTVAHTLAAPGSGWTKRRAYLHVVQTGGYNTGKPAGATVQINGGLVLAEGDGASAIAPGGDVIEVKNVGDKVAEVMLFDIE